MGDGNTADFGFEFDKDGNLVVALPTDIVEAIRAAAPKELRRSRGTTRLNLGKQAIFTKMVVLRTDQPPCKPPKAK